MGIADARGKEAAKGTELKTSFEKIRRQDLLEAAFLTFLDHGLNGMTMARIGERAGMSHGIVNYYFKNKAALLNAVMRKANGMIMRDVARRLNRAVTPRERLSAIVAGNFPPELFTRNVARAWISFYAAVSTQPDFEVLQNIVYRRQRSNLIDALRSLTGPAEGECIALGVSVWIDGLWMRQAMERTAMTPEAAVRAIENYIDTALAEA